MEAVKDTNIYKKFYNPLRNGGRAPSRAEDSSSSTSSSSSTPVSSSAPISMDDALQQLPTLLRTNGNGSGNGWGPSRAREEERGREEEFNCDECGKVFQAKQNLNTHMRRYHKTEILVCHWEGCNKTYKHRYYLKLLK